MGALSNLSLIHKERNNTYNIHSQMSGAFCLMGAPMLRSVKYTVCPNKWTAFPIALHFSSSHLYTNSALMH